MFSWRATWYFIVVSTPALAGGARVRGGTTPPPTQPPIEKILDTGLGNAGGQVTFPNPEPIKDISIIPVHAH
jgi:hypothetical protein